MAGIDIISDSTGKEIVAAIKSTDVAQARILEINTAAEAKKNEVLESIPEDYSNISKEVDELKSDLARLGAKSDYDSRTTEYIKEHTIMYSANSFSASNNYTVLAFIPVAFGDVVKYSGFTGANTVVAIINGYESDDVTTWTGYSVKADGQTYNNREFVIDDERVKFIACCFRTENGDPYSVSVVHNLQRSIAREIKPISDRLTIVENQTKEVVNWWKGKKIVWFGTSIPAAGFKGNEQPYTYPKYVGELLGANVVNEAVGSSPIHCRRSGRVSETNPYGFNSNFTATARALASSLEEKQWIINWLKAKLNGGVYVSGYVNDCPFDSSIFTSTVPSTFTDSDAEDIKDCSWERKLTKHLGADNRADLYVIDHGYNDYMLDDKNYSEEDPYNLYFYRGAMNFIISKILADNPMAKIVTITHYTDQLPSSVLSYGKGMIEYEEAVADDWNLPCCKLYKVLGISSKYAFDTKWSVVDGVPTEGTSITSKTTMDLYVPDGVHPSSNASHKSLEYIAKTIAKWIDANVVNYD